MALTFNLAPPEGGIVISGSSDELEALAQCIREVLDGEDEVIGHLLTETGIEELAVRVVA